MDRIRNKYISTQTVLGGACIASVLGVAHADVTHRFATFGFPVEESEFFIGNGLPSDTNGNPLDSDGFLIVEGAGTNYTTRTFHFSHTTYFVNGFLIPPFINNASLVVSNDAIYTIDGDIDISGHPYVRTAISVSNGGQLTAGDVFGQFDFDSPRKFDLTVSGSARFEFDHFNLGFNDDFSFSSYEYNNYFGSSEEFRINVNSNANVVGSSAGFFGDHTDLDQTVISITGADWEVGSSFLTAVTANVNSNARVLGGTWQSDNSSISISDSTVEVDFLNSTFDSTFDVRDSTVQSDDISLHETQAIFERSLIDAGFFSVVGGFLETDETDFRATNISFGFNPFEGSSYTLRNSSLESGGFGIDASTFIAEDSDFSVTTAFFVDSMVSLTNSDLTTDALSITGGRLNLYSSDILSNDELFTSTSIEVTSGGILSAIDSTMGRLFVDEFSTLQVEGGTVTVGDQNHTNAFRVDGITSVSGGLLDISSFLTLARLGIETTLENGVIRSNTGMFLPDASLFRGYGKAIGPFVAAIGSIISASGDLEVGDETALNGFFSNGNLLVNNHVVHLHDANRAVLGSLTVLGNDDGAGTLVAPNGLLVDFAINITGHGIIIGDILNNGFIEGAGPLQTDVLDLQGLVTGVGDFGGTVQFSGGFSPGLSPTIIEGENFIFDSVLTIEIGGLTPGDQHDQIRASGSIQFGGILEIEFIDDFVPTSGDAFVLFLADEVLGEFDDIVLPNLPAGIYWSDLFSSPGGTISLSVVNTIPIPPTVWLLTGGLLGAWRIAKRPRSRGNTPSISALCSETEASSAE